MSRQASRRGAPAGRGRGPRGASPRRRGRTLVKLLVALALVAGGAAVGAVAVMFGLVPGFRVRSPFERLADSTTTATADSQALPGPTAADTVPLPTLADTTAPLPPLGGTVTAADSADGELVYRGAGRCVSCHGATGEGVAGLGPSLRDDRWLVGDGSLAAIARAVRDGVAPPLEFPIAMPAYAGQLTDDAIARVAGYVYVLSHPGALQPDTLAAPTDTTRPPSPPR